MTDGSVSPDQRDVAPAQKPREQSKPGFLARFRLRGAPAQTPPAQDDAVIKIDDVRAKLRSERAGGEEKDIVEELMPKVREILSKEGPVDEARMLKLMDEIEKSEELKGHVHTLDQGKDRAIILTNQVNKVTEGTSYGPAINPQELIPAGTMTTEQSEWLALNRKGFVKVLIIDSQNLKIDESSEYFDGRRYPDDHYARGGGKYEGPIKPERVWIDRTREWADRVEKGVKHIFGDKNRDALDKVFDLRDYPQIPDNAGWADPSVIASKFHPEGIFNNLYRTEDERRASRALRWGLMENTYGWDMRQGPDFYRVKAPDFVQEALKANVVPPKPN